MKQSHKKGCNGQSLDAAPVTTAARFRDNPRIPVTGNLDEEVAQLAVVLNLAVLGEWFASLGAIAKPQNTTNLIADATTKFPILESA